ncbi:MAG TPA: cytochrome c oxidase assembly protein [Bryobacteraceae bacterium]|nr:cytochrome c oxidase assembly protein [Bryobacteraceae bacterium]
MSSSFRVAHSIHPGTGDKRRLAAVMTGLVVLWVVLGSPFASLDHQFLIAHMLQHLLLMTVAAPLFLLGAPGIVRRLRSRLHPVLCWLAGTGTVMVWHVPALFQAGMQAPGWHAVEHASFLAAGLLFWFPVVPFKPGGDAGSPWSAPVYLFLATLPCDVLSAFLTFCNRVVYPHYQSVPRAWGLSPLADQEIAGALMWTWVTFAYLIPAVAITVRTLSPHERRSPVEAM